MPTPASRNLSAFGGSGTIWVGWGVLEYWYHSELFSSKKVRTSDNKSDQIKKKTLEFLKQINFEYTHPFVDGNGRIGRVINNYLLIREGFVPINIKFIDRLNYYEAFKEFNEKGTTAVMEKIVGKALTNSYHKRLAYLEGKTIMNLSDFTKISHLSHSNLLNKANRQTIEAFLEKGVWKIGV